MKSKLIAGFLILSLSLFAVPYVWAQEANTNQGEEIDLCSKMSAKYGADSINCIMNISLYREFYKQWKKMGYKGPTIKDAITPWRWVFLNCPCGTQNTYIDGVNIMEYQIKNTTTDKDRDALIDTLMMVYDNRIKYFNRKGYVRGRQGVDLYRLRTSDYDQAYEYFKESVELEETKSVGPVLIYYFRTTIKMATSGKLDSTAIVENFDQISNIIDKNIKKYTDKGNVKKVTEWENVKGNIDMTFEPFAKCEDLVKIYTVKFNESPHDVELLKKVTELLDKKKCNATELFFNASVNLYEQEPTPESAFMIGKMYINAKDYEKALKYLQESTAMENTEKLADVYYYLAFCHQMRGNKIQARANALKAIDNNPNYGDPYLLIGDLYAASTNECNADDLEKRAVYWVAVDMYAKAKSVDPSVTDAANSRINEYSKYFPTKEIAFFRDFKDGDTYKVGCWINRQTTVRTTE